MSHLPWLNDLRFQLDQLNYYWHKTVLNFNKDKQGSLLKDWFGSGFLKKSLYALAAIFCSLFFFIALVVLWRKPNRKESDLVKTLRLFDKKISAVVEPRRDNEGLADYSLRLQQLYPEHAGSIRRLFDQLQYHYFSGVNSGANKKSREKNAEKTAEKNERLLAKNLMQLARRLGKS